MVRRSAGRSRGVPRELADRGRPGPVPGARGLRERGARRVRGVEGRRADGAPGVAAGRPAPGRRSRRAVLPHPCPDDRGGRLMPEYPRAELEEMVERWLQVNKDAEA